METTHNTTERIFCAVLRHDCVICTYRYLIGFTISTPTPIIVYNPHSSHAHKQRVGLSATRLSYKRKYWAAGLGRIHIENVVCNFDY